MTDARAVVSRLIEVFNTGDVDDVPALLSEGYVDHQGLEGIDIRGHEGFRRVVAAARSHLNGLVVSVEDLVAEGEKVVVRLRWRGVRRDGKQVVRETIDILHLKDDRVSEHWGAESSSSES